MVDIASALKAGSDPATAVDLSAASTIGGFVDVELIWPTPCTARLATDQRSAVQQVLERHAVVGVGARQHEGERGAGPIGDQVALRAEPASIGRIQPRLIASFSAASDARSMQARLQSMRSADRSRPSNSQRELVPKVAACQSRGRRKHVMPDPHPISSGSISNWMPVRSTNRIPVSAARSGTRSLPLRDRGGTTGSKSAMMIKERRTPGEKPCPSMIQIAKQNKVLESALYRHQKANEVFGFKVSNLSNR